MRKITKSVLYKKEREYYTDKELMIGIEYYITEEYTIEIENLKVIVRENLMAII